MTRDDALHMARLAGLLTFAGCYMGSEFDDRVDDRGGAGSTTKFNTPAFAGYDELDTRGQIWKGAGLNPVSLSCWRVAVTPAECADSPWFMLDAVWSDRGELWGENDGVRYRGDDFIDSKWSFVEYFGGVPNLGHPPLLSVRNHDTLYGQHRYFFETFGVDAAWGPYCSEEEGGAAYVLGDVTVDTETGVFSSRPGTLYLACAGGAVGKAVYWGYTPWELGLANFTMALRVVRADYCADGHAWTREGVGVQLVDVWGINGFSNAGLADEALWDEAGVLCLSDTRIHEAVDPLQKPVPNTYPKPGIAPCALGPCGGDSTEAGPVSCNGVPVPRCDPKTMSLLFNDELPPLTQGRQGKIWTKYL